MIVQVLKIPYIEDWIDDIEGELEDIGLEIDYKLGIL